MSIEHTIQQYWETQIPAITRCYVGNINETPVEPYMTQKLVTKVDAGFGTTQLRLQLDIYTQDPDGYGTAKEIGESLTGAIRSLESGNIFASYRANEIEDFENIPDKYRLTIDAMIYYDDVSIFS